MRARSRTSPIIAAAGAALLITLTACSQPAPQTAASASKPAATAEAEACSGLTGAEALARWAGEVATTQPWDLTGEYSDTSGYDDCADISWIALRPELCCTAFEITPIMFFHRGEFVPGATVTDRAIDRQTAPERTSDSEVVLTFAMSAGPDMPPTRTSITYSWDGGTGTVIAHEPEPGASHTTGGDASGYWCPTPESTDTYGCVTIALPIATYDSGDTRELTDRGDLYGDGGTTYIAPGAPFGTFYPAGTPIALPDYYAGSDLPDRDRIWNGQSAVMLVRQ